MVRRIVSLSNLVGRKIIIFEFDGIGYGLMERLPAISKEFLLVEGT